ncbi:MAG: glutamate:Na+ symporter, family [Acidobacteriota bacterium]|nr:glutamate:Na+ symporter, family [Acidobacteriota bacterium]
MEFSVVEGLRTVKLDLVLSLALAALVLFVGYFVQRRVGVLARANIPAAAVGGLLFAGAVFALRASGVLGVSLNTTLRAPLQTAFFTTIGLGATLGLLRAGGWRMGFFWLIATLAAVVQNVVGMALAVALGAPALLGVICGALTLTGGPATGQAWEARFTELGIEGAGSLIIASALFGIFVSSLVGNPIATALIRRFRLARERERGVDSTEEEKFRVLSPTVAPADDEDEVRGVEREEAGLDASVLLRNLLLVLLVMGAGAVLSLLIRHPSFTLPDYIGAMVVAAVVRNVDERTGWFRLNERAVGAIATVSLALFLVIALMSLELWKIAGLALPMLVILCAQVLVTVAYAVFVTFVLMGRDYEAAVTAGGHIGFGLGITANAVANMETLVERYAPAPRSFLVVPVVGAFFIDFSNALVIGLFINLYANFAR